jgi:hypothetical protein
MQTKTDCGDGTMLGKLEEPNSHFYPVPDNGIK